jgi:hypothetical protein
MVEEEVVPVCDILFLARKGLNCVGNSHLLLS